jgi:hypothetical protein
MPLETSLEKICFIIIKARELDVTEGVVEPRRASNPGDEGSHAVLADYRDNPASRELKAFIDNLNEDEQTELVALAWHGRGDYSTMEWGQALVDARTRRDLPASDYLLQMPLLGDLLEEGLAQLGLS